MVPDLRRRQRRRSASPSLQQASAAGAHRASYRGRQNLLAELIRRCILLAAEAAAAWWAISTIDYTALSFVAPEKVLFRYKLEGLDPDWQDAGNRRQAFYTNLSPGNYRFRVTACNNSGVWNEAGDFLDFSIAPAYYQTNWFRALCAAALLALLWALYQFRVLELRRQERKLRDVIETIPTFAWTALPDGSVDFVNRNWQEYTGLPTEQNARHGLATGRSPRGLEAKHGEVERVYGDGRALRR